MHESLKNLKVAHLYHFTDNENLPSIRANGLLSWRELEKRKIDTPLPGGNDWSRTADLLAGVDDYVHLALCDDHPMLFRARQDGRIKTGVVLCIDISVLLLPGVMFTDDVSNKSGVRLLDAASAKDSIDLEVLFTRTNWQDPEIKERRKRAKKCEVLVPKHIPIRYILKRL